MAIIPVKNLTTEDILYGDRTTQYRWEVLEHSNGVDYLVGTLDGVSEGSLAWVQNAAVKGRGKMEVIDLPAAAPGILRIGELPLETCRIRPVMTLNGADQTGSYQDVWVEEAINIFKGAWATILANRAAVSWGGSEWQQFTPTSANGGMRSTVDLADLTDGLTYTVVAEVANPGSAPITLDRVSWCDVAGTFTPVTLAPGQRKVLRFSAARADYTTTYRFIDIRALSASAVFLVRELTLVEGIYEGTPFSGSTVSPVPYRRFRWLGTANASPSVAEIRTQEWVSSGESVIPEIPWGTFLLEKASEDWEDTGRVWKLSLLDRTTVPSQDVVDQSYAVAAGTNILQEVRAILATSGEYMAIDESVDLATRSGMVWEAGTSKLNIINDLLDSAGYNSLWMDGWGNFQATPRVLPADRSIIYELLGFPRELADGEKSIYSPEWTRERDSFRVPNKVIAVQAAGGEDEEALVGQWTNEDPASPYSYISRGRWIPHVLDSVDCPEGTEAEILAFLEARARATLIQMSAVQAEVKVEHLPIPVRVGDVLRFANTRAGIDTRHTITRLDLDTSPTGLMKSTLQEVISL